MWLDWECCMLYLRLIITGILSVRKFFYFVSIFLMALVQTPLGKEVNGARRWLNLGFTQFQPSDLTKILMILFFAKFLMEREQKIKEPKTIIQAIALILPSLALIYKQPNLSTTICIAALLLSFLTLED